MTKELGKAVYISKALLGYPKIEDLGVVGKVPAPKPYQVNWENKRHMPFLGTHH